MDAQGHQGSGRTSGIIPTPSKTFRCQRKPQILRKVGLRLNRLTDHTVGQKRLQLPESGQPSQVVPHHQNHIGFLTGFDHFFGIRNRIGNRFFNKDVLAVPGCENGLFGMHGIGTDQMDGVDVIALKDIFIGRFLMATQFLAQRLPFFGYHIETGHQSKLFALHYGIADGA